MNFSMYFTIISSIASIALAILTFLRLRKNDSTESAEGYAELKLTVKMQQTEINTLKTEVGGLKTQIHTLEQDTRKEIKEMEKNILSKVDKMDDKIDDIKDYLIKTLNK